MAKEKIPALPSASTMQLIGTDRSLNVIPGNNSFTITPISSGGKSLAIEIAPNEFIRISLRSGGFDSALPGSGILVEHQDKNNGNLENNLVNIDPELAWVKIIEADGDDALMRGRNSGEIGDLFNLDDMFGNLGIQIRDNRGRLVTWTAFVSDININDDDSWNNATISFENEAINNLQVLTPRQPIVLLEGEKSYAKVDALEACELLINLNYQGISITKEISISSGTSYIEIINSSSSSNFKRTSKRTNWL